MSRDPQDDATPAASADPTSGPASGRRDEPDLPALLDDGLSLFEAQVRTIEKDDWDKPTPCAEWTVKDLVGHVVGTMTSGANILRGEPVDRSTKRPGDVLGDAPAPEEVADTVQELARGFRAALATADMSKELETPMGPRSVAEGLAFPIVDLAVHSWDLGTALGQPVELPAPLLAYADGFSHEAPESVLRNPRAFGPPVEPEDDASPTERFVAFLGRPTPRIDRGETVPPTGGAHGQASGSPQDDRLDPPTRPALNPTGLQAPAEEEAVDEENKAAAARVWEKLSQPASSGSSQWVVDQLAEIDEAGTTEVVDVQGMPVVVLTMLGSRSGTPRRVPLMRVEHDGVYTAVASKGGAPEHPQWYHNLVAHPELLLQDGTETTRRRARLVEGAERSTWWARCVQAFPPYAEYVTKAGDREIPVFLLEPVED